MFSIENIVRTLGLVYEKWPKGGCEGDMLKRPDLDYDLAQKSIERSLLA